MKKVSVIGLGIIGRIWAAHYRADGHEVKAWNRTPHPELTGFERSITAAVEDVEMIHLCVADPPAVQAVLDKITPVLTRGALVIQSSTISPAAAEKFARQVKAAGGRYVEAPFTGSKPAAESRQLVFFIGGEASDREAAAVWLGPLSRQQFHFDRPERAAAIKLAMNLQIAAVSQAMIEGLHLARRYGLSAEDFFAVLDVNVARSGLLDLKREKFLARDYRPQFSVKHMGKDLKLALEAAGDLTLHLTERTGEIFERGLAHGLGEEDFIALEKLLEL